MKKLVRYRIRYDLLNAEAQTIIHGWLFQQLEGISVASIYRLLGSAGL
jgi:hypothetical protein